MKINLERTYDNEFELGASFKNNLKVVKEDEKDNGNLEPVIVTNEKFQKIFFNNTAGSSGYQNEFSLAMIIGSIILICLG